MSSCTYVCPYVCLSVLPLTRRMLQHGDKSLHHRPSQTAGSALEEGEGRGGEGEGEDEVFTTARRTAHTQVSAAYSGYTLSLPHTPTPNTSQVLHATGRSSMQLPVCIGHLQH